MAGVDADRDGAVFGDGDFHCINTARCHVDVVLGKNNVVLTFGEVGSNSFLLSLNLTF